MTKKEQQIVAELQDIDVTSFPDGLSFVEHYKIAHEITNIEQLLFYYKCPKYYYNFAEKRLRKITTVLDNLDSITQLAETGVILTCKDLEDDDKISFTPEQFSNKVICYEDNHKIITHDMSTQHYECFYIAASNTKIEEYLESNRKLMEAVSSTYDLLMQDNKNSKNHKEKVGSSISKEDEDDAFTDACTLISMYLLSHLGDISEVRFVVTASNKVRVDIVTSKEYRINDDSSNSVSFS